MTSIPALDRYLGKWIRRRRVPGVAYGLAHRGRPLLVKGYGFRDVRERKPVTSRTLFGIASMTKSVTAAAILRLQEDGRLRVSDPVVRHLPDFRVPGKGWTRKIRLHHLLTHTSSLPPLPTLWYSLWRSVVHELPFSLRNGRDSGVNPSHPPVESFPQLIEFLATARYRPLGPVGSQFSYSNDGYALLGAVVERVSGVPYEQYVDRELFHPAGMSHTTFDPGVLLRVEDRSTLYSPNYARRGRRHRPVASSEWWETTCFRAAGGLRSNVEDLLRYLELFQRSGRVGRERILEPASLRVMTKPHIEAFPGVWYGYGLRVSRDGAEVRMVSHEGGLKGVSSAMAAIPGKGLGAVALTNQDGVNSRFLVNAGLNARLDRPLEAPFEDPPQASEPGRLADYVGTYGCGEGWWATVTVNQKGLRLDFTGVELTSRRLRLRPRGEDVFVISDAGDTTYVRFMRDEQGRVNALHAGWRVIRKRKPAERRLARQERIVW